MADVFRLMTKWLLWLLIIGFGPGMLSAEALGDELQAVDAGIPDSEQADDMTLADAGVDEIQNDEADDIPTVGNNVVWEEEERANSHRVEWEEHSDTTTDRTVSNSNNSQAEKGPRYVLQKVVITGNKKNLKHLIFRYLDIPVGEVFYADDPRLSAFRYRLLASGRFHDVQLTLQKGSKRGWVTLQVTVTERNTIVIQDIALGFSEISDFYGSIDVAERSFLGTGIELSAAVVFSLDEQYGYRLRLQDDHFLNSPLSLHVEGLFAKARDFFGRDNVCVEVSNEAEPSGHRCAVDTAGSRYQKDVEYAVLRYRRAGIRIGTGYTLLKDNYFWVDYRGEVIAANVPKAGYHKSFGEYRPIEFGHLLWGHSGLSSIIFGLTRDTRDSMTLASEGARTALEVELSTELLRSDYEFSKFTLTHERYFQIRQGHSLKLGLFGGLIMGNAPFFNQFFVGDFSSFVPSRVLDLNFSHLQPNLLESTTIREMRYEDIAASMSLEYSLSFYRGSGIVYGVNGFASFGVFFVASKEHLKSDPKGYSGLQLLPIDITLDIGIKVDTKVGMFVVSLANLLPLVPEQPAAEK